MPRFGGMGGAFGRMGGGGKVPAAAAAAFSPLSLTPDLWIDPSDTATMFQSNAGTTTVTDTSVCGYAGDKSGNAFHLTSAADDTTRPTWNNNSGLPYLNFDGSNDVLLRTASLGMYAAGACSIFAAIKANPSVASLNMICERNSASVNATYICGRSGGTTTTAGGFLRNDVPTAFLTDSPAELLLFNNTDKVLGWTDDGATVQWYTNGTAGASAGYVRAGVVTVDRFSFGASVSTTTSGWIAVRLYGLIIVKRVVSASERANIVTYLGAKMGQVL